MRNYRGVLLIGIIEVLIGSITLFTTVISIVLSTNQKTPNVLIFVVVAACVSTLIGIGILRLKKVAYQLLLYFSSVVLLSKLLIFTGIIEFNGALETAVPTSFKNLVSIVYHGFLIIYLSRKDIKNIFHV